MNAHAHNWQIKSPNGPTSTGTCQGCGEEREFLNYIAPLDWGNMLGCTLQQLNKIRRAAAQTEAVWRERLDQ